MVEQQVEDGGHGQQASHVVALDEIEQGARLEAAEHDVLAADHGQEVGRAPAVDVEQRDHVQDDIVLGEAQPELRVQAVQVELPVGHRHALGQSGRAARVEQLGHGVLVDVRGQRFGRGGRQERLVFELGHAARLPFDDHEARPAAELRCDLLEERGEVALEEDDLRAGVVEDVGDLVGCQADVDRVEHGARLDDAVVRLQQLVGVVGQERHPLARLDAEPEQGVGQAVRSFGVFPVGELPIAVDDPDSVAEEGRRSVAELEDGERNEHRKSPLLGLKNRWRCEPIGLRPGYDVVDRGAHRGCLNAPCRVCGISRRRVTQSAGAGGRQVGSPSRRDVGRWYGSRSLAFARRPPRRICRTE